MSVENKPLSGIDTVIIRVSDIEVSKQWYIETLGFNTLWEDKEMKLVVLDTGSQPGLTLWQTEHKISINKETASYPIFRTENANNAKIILEQKGVNTDEIITDSHVTYFRFYDPDGNVIEACEVHE